MSTKSGRGSQADSFFVFLRVALLAADHDVTGTGLDKALYRPGALVYPSGNRTT